MYDPETQTVYLLIGWDIKNMEDRSRLLHELTHHVQYKVPDYKSQYNCASKMEAESIRITDMWREKNVLPLVVPPDDAVSNAILFLWSNCMNSPHH